MARLIRGLTSAPLRAHLAACGVASGSSAGRAFGRVVAALADAEQLPAPGDATTLVSDESRGVSTLAHVRRVPAQNIWLWYRVLRSGDVELLTVKSEPP